MTRALVTGGAGFLGRSLATRLLAEGYEVSFETRHLVSSPPFDGEPDAIQLDFGTELPWVLPDGLRSTCPSPPDMETVPFRPPSTSCSRPP